MVQEQLIRSIYDAINSHDLNKFTSFFSADGQFKDISSEKVFRGKNEIRGMAEGWLKAFPDMKLQVSSIIGNGDSYSVELSLLGTHTGPLSGPEGEITATGKKVTVPSCDVFRLKNGKIYSLNCYFAANILMKQLGVLSMQRAA